jgi:hypothetical protein
MHRSVARRCLEELPRRKQRGRDPHRYAKYEVRNPDADDSHQRKDSRLSRHDNRLFDSRKGEGHRKDYIEKIC